MSEDHTVGLDLEKSIFTPISQLRTTAGTHKGPKETVLARVGVREFLMACVWSIETRRG